MVEIYTDGACKGNPGVGGWGALLRCGEVEKEISGGELSTTNNRMELTAVIRALEALKRSSRLKLHTDSLYVKQGVCEWLRDWKKREWLTSGKKPVKNADLWRRLDELVQKHEIEWVWVRGHSGHDDNERADALANRGVKSVKRTAVQD